MARKSIGIDIGRYHVRAVQIARTEDGLRMEKTFERHTRRSTDSPVDILRELVGLQGFDRKADVAVSLPHHAVFFADTRVDAATATKLDSADSSALKDSFPIPPEEAIVQVCSNRPLADEQRSVLVAATSSALLQEELDLLSEAYIRPTLVDTPATAAHVAIAVNHPEAGDGTILLCGVDEALLSLAVAQDGQLLMVRNIPLAAAHGCEPDALAQEVADVLSREIEITWQKLFSADPEADLRIFLTAAPEAAEFLTATLESQIGCRITVVDPYAHVESSAGAIANFPVCVAEGLALRMLELCPSGRVNFLVPYAARTRPRVNIRRELVTCGVLLVALAVIWTVGLFVQRVRLESQYEQIKTQERNLFRQTLPEEENIVSPLAQIQQKLDSFRNESALLASLGPDRLAPLEVLRLLSAYHPSDGGLQLDDLSITADSVRIMGRCNSFAAVTDWQRVLEGIPDFEIANGPNPEKDPETGKVRFTLSLSTRKAVP